MRKANHRLYALLIPVVLTCLSCTKGEGINIFSLSQDIEFGQQVSAEIESNSQQYPILPESGRNGKNEAAYTYLRSIVGRILSSGQVTYQEEFPWQVKIIQDDKTLNAFAAPGGYIYVYTGLIKYLDTEDQLAGVLAHEIAHADKRHTTRALTRQYGYQLLLDIVLGQDQGALTEIAQGLVNLTYSRGSEREADEYSVVYLCNTKYKSDGAAGFFQKMQQENSGQGVPEFLSTHPNPGNRVQDITEKAQTDNCNLNNYANAQYAKFQNLLP